MSYLITSTLPSNYTSFVPMGSATPILDTVHIFIVLEFGLIPHWQKLMEKSPT